LYKILSCFRVFVAVVSWANRRVGNLEGLRDIRGMGICHENTKTRSFFF
jgi:hypothetical protein